MNSLLLFISNVGNFIDVNVLNRNAHNHQCRRILAMSVHSYIRFNYLCTPTSTRTLVNNGVSRVS